MAKKTVSVDVAGGTYDLLLACGEFVGAVKKALADGWQIGSDIPVIISAAVQEMGRVASDVSEARAEVAGDKALVAEAIAVGGAALVAKAIA